MDIKLGDVVELCGVIGARWVVVQLKHLADGTMVVENGGLRKLVHVNDVIGVWHK